MEKLAATAAVAAVFTVFAFFRNPGDMNLSGVVIVQASEAGTEAGNVLMSELTVEDLDPSDPEYDAARSAVFGTEWTRSEITSVTLLSTLETEPEDSLDVSEAQDGTVKAWIEEEGDLYIAAQGGVRLPEDSSFLFCGYENAVSIDLSGADTSGVTNMESMFLGCYKLSKLDLSGFVTDNVTNMGSMFAWCDSLESLNLSGIVTSGVTNMGAMFFRCQSLMSLDLSGFDTSNVTDMYFMFNQCGSLQSLDVSMFDTANVTDMQCMFYKCRELTDLDISGFDTSNVTAMNSMFFSCESLTSLDVSGFDTSNVTDMSYMFCKCESLTSLDVSGFDMSNADTEYMFEGCEDAEIIYASEEAGAEAGNVLMPDTIEDYDSDTKYFVFGSQWKRSEITSITFLNNLDGEPESSWDVSEAQDGTVKAWVEDGEALYIASNGGVCLPEDCSYLLCGYENVENLDFGEIDTGNVTNMRSMFDYCESLTSLDVGRFDTGNVTDMGFMFHNCYNLISLDVSGFDTSNVTDMGSMFGTTGRNLSGTNLLSLNVSGFDTSNVTDMSSMFYMCDDLTSLDVGSFDTGNVTDMSNMFYGCHDLTSLDVSGFDMSNADTEDMFKGCENAEIIECPGIWGSVLVVFMRIRQETG